MTEAKRPLKVFLCHAHADRDSVHGLYTRLTQDGVDAWLDKEKLLPGQDWELEIKKAVREADVVVVCLSKQFNQAGFRQKEVRLALDTAMEQPEGEIFIIPARLEECDTLESLRKWHWVDLFGEGGYPKLVKALKLRSEQLGRISRSSPQVDENEQITAVTPKLIPKRPSVKVLPSPAKEEEPQKRPRKPKPEIIIVVIGVAATFLAALIGILPQIVNLAPDPTIITMPTSTVLTQVSIQHTLSYRDFLGKSINDPDVKVIADAFCEPDQYGFMICPKLGIEYGQTNNVIDKVFVYASANSYIFDGYKGELPNGLKWSDTVVDVIDKIGPPDGNLNYGWDYASLGLIIHYKTDAPSTPEPSETISYIGFFLP